MPIPTISGGVFNFTEAGYTPPTWSGSSYEFEVVKLNEIYTDPQYVYAAIDTGLDIIDIDKERKCAYIEYANGFTTVWGNDVSVFLGSTSSGIKYINKSDITIDILNPVNLTDYLRSFKEYPNITSNRIKHIHGRENKLMCCTSSGVDVFRLEPDGYRSSTTVSGAYKCFVPPGRTAYYLTFSGIDYFINKLNHTLTDWVAPDEIFTVDSGLKINDLFVTAYTAVGGTKNTLFIATSSGTYVTDEATYEVDVYYTAE